VVALGLWLFWRGQDRASGWWLGSGFVAGASLGFRPSNVLVFAPLFLGTVLRGERRCWALMAGGLAGLAVRLGGMQLYFGNALFERGRYYFAPETIMERLPLFLLGLLVFVPGGLLFALAYRGRRRPEVLVTVVGFLSFYLFQTYSTIETGPSKRLVLALRYVVPLLPLLCFAMAESLPRFWRELLARVAPPARLRLQFAAAAAIVLYLTGVGLAAGAVHPVLARWTDSQRQIRDAIVRHTGDHPLVTNLHATLKFLPILRLELDPVSTINLTVDQLAKLIDRHGELTLVLLDRTDSEFWREDARQNQGLVDALEPPPEVLFDEQINATDRLRIWRVRKVHLPGNASMDEGDGDHESIPEPPGAAAAS
jgi:hypothetical protein